MIDIFIYIGFTICLICILTILYAIFYFIGNEEEWAGIVGLILVGSIIAGVLFMNFRTNPENYGYQKINTISINEVEK